MQQILAKARQALDSGKLGQTETLCKQVLAQTSRNPEALYLMGCALHGQHRRDEAIDHLQRCAKLDPRNSTVHVKLGEVLMAHGRHDAALARFDKACRLDPNSPVAICGKAQVFDRKGRHDKVASLLRPIVESGRETAAMARLYARSLEEDGRQEEAITLIQRHVADPSSPPQSRRELLFLLGKIHERRGDFDSSFAAYEKANAETVVPYDPDAYRRRVDGLIELFSPRNLALFPRAAHGLDVPVFVLGMPRTGSTLVERIIDAHPAACGVGEAPLMPELVRCLSLKIGSTLPYPQCVRQLTSASADEVGRAYVNDLQAMARSARRIVDKYLTNFEHLGLLALILPEARVIDCRRDPLDTCLSCFGEALDPYGHPYAANLADLGRHYRQYERLMKHWRSVLEIRMMELRYEDLIADPEGVSRRIIEFIDLPWDDRCLRYYEKKREVMTFSREQVDKPIYRSSVNRAGRFAAHLDPLRRALAGEV